MILIFGGTTEGRIVSSVLDESGKEYYYSTKGAFQEVDLVHGERVSGAMTHEVMRDFIREISTSSSTPPIPSPPSSTRPSER